ncbi:hypothetical protein BBJK_00925 [Bifidobacterium bifidum LMG 13195]|uniref:polyribonucleotide nucleotidyltransferase n=1 Tax=Bifidobacterium bifidum LMG 13195 TaxID=1207542 RepID=A0A286TBC6_BIFBI|nr:hypothetical protein BBJK_00925 [Bifidobacterium bifidum LMG 13195]
MEGPEIKAVEAVIDNGSFGKRTLRFETGRLAQQADGAVAAYLDDDSMILSTTTAGSSPKENYDFFPLTVDVEEKMYAAGKIPGSFFRREGRPSSEAILACRIIDRPLRPLFPHTLRNEVQVVETVLSIDPDDAYDVIALNAASASTMISGLPFEGPVSGVRLALIDGQWVAFPRWSERERAVFEIVVAGRVIENGDVAIAMIEAGAGKNAWHLIYDEGQIKPDEEVVAQGLEAAKPFIKVICEAQNELKEKAAKETRTSSCSPSTPTSCTPASTRSPTRTSTRHCPSRRSCRARTASTRSRSTCVRCSRTSSPTWTMPRRRRNSATRSRSCSARSCAAASSPRTTASTAVACATSAPCPPRWTSCRACTAPPCSSAARPRSWASPR